MVLVQLICYNIHAGYRQVCVSKLSHWGIRGVASGEKPVKPSPLSVKALPDIYPLMIDLGNSFSIFLFYTQL